MRNIPLPFVSEETLDLIARQSNNAQKRATSLLESEGFQSFANTQRIMRGVPNWPAASYQVSESLTEAIGRGAKRVVAWLEKLLECDGPNSIANLEKALRRQTNIGRALSSPESQLATEYDQR